ncbi:MAG: hypothetical protein IKS32_04600 [Solobacterium sp.]|nr:hypothetical protein [Solobacterium sp.]
MAKITSQEREEIKLQIQEESILLTRVKRYVQYSVLIVLICAAFLLTFLKDSTSPWRIVVIVIAVIAGVFALFSIIAYYRGRKHVLNRINYLDANK